MTFMYLMLIPLWCSRIHPMWNCDFAGDDFAFVDTLQAMSINIVSCDGQKLEWKILCETPSQFSVFLYEFNSSSIIPRNELKYANILLNSVPKSQHPSTPIYVLCIELFRYTTLMLSDGFDAIHKYTWLRLFVQFYFPFVLIAVPWLCSSQVKYRRMISFVANHICVFFFIFCFYSTVSCESVYFTSSSPYKRTFTAVLCFVDSTFIGSFAFTRILRHI